ncbi:MAG: hypothetical protein JXR76_11225 [Deltaproteobacteria bacterium]|nr:hypothetical protein [Deltaproteobacteria bacterium]
MRSFCIVLLTGSILMIAPLLHAADDEKVIPEESASPSESSSEMVVDTEPTPKTDAEGRVIDADFISIGGTAAWLKRNGLGAHFGFGGYTCGREYCNTALDTSMLGSISLILGAYYKFNPNWSVFVDLTIAHLNTNFRDNQYGDVGANRGVAVQFLFGPAFHLPVKGWLDLYTSLGFGPISLRVKTEGVDKVKHRWGGFDIEWTIGASVYIWSVGFLKDLSMGPFMKFGFPLWIRVCDEVDGVDVGGCQKPSDMDNQDQMFWSEAPFTFQMGLEVRYEFSFLNRPKKALPPAATKMDPDVSTEKDDKAGNEVSSDMGFDI